MPLQCFFNQHNSIPGGSISKALHVGSLPVLIDCVFFSYWIDVLLYGLMLFIS